MAVIWDRIKEWWSVEKKKRENDNQLIHCGLVTPCGDRELGQHWFRWCLTAPSHYLNQCWLIMHLVLWHPSEKNVIGISQNINSKKELENYNFENIASPRGQWVNYITQSQIYTGLFLGHGILFGICYLNDFHNKHSLWANFSVWHHTFWGHLCDWLDKLHINLENYFLVSSQYLLSHILTDWHLYIFNI